MLPNQKQTLLSVALNLEQRAKDFQEQDTKDNQETWSIIFRNINSIIKQLRELK